MVDGRTARVCRGWVVAATALALTACGSDANLGVSGSQPCDGASGPVVRGVVRLPNGRLAARSGSLFERLAAVAVAPVEALTGSVSPVGRGVRVDLVQLRPEDVARGSQPGPVAHAFTNGTGEFCVPLLRDTTVDVCRYMVRVGNAGDGTLTRAFVHSTDEPTDIDFASEATVQVVLAAIAPDDLCEYSPAEFAAIYDAVRAVPGNVGGGSAAEVNAVASTLASADPTVRALVRQAGNLPPPATPVAGAPTPTVTRGSGSRATATATDAISTHTVRPTRTPGGNTPTASATRTAGATRTPTASAATPTPTRPAPATATATPRAATATAPAATATATPPAVTPTFTATPMPGGPLGERVFTIREDSQFPGEDPRVGFFTSALSGRSVSDKFSEGPLVFVAGAPDANGIATLRLKEDAYFKINVPAGGTVLCLRLLAAGSSGRIDCDGGTPFDITLTAASGPDAPVPPAQTGQGSDSGPGAAELSVMQSIAELTAFSAACDATVTFPEPSTSIYTTGTFTATKGARTLAKHGENFDCATWTMTDGPGMLVNGVVAYEQRAGGDSASATRLADR
jgi:hypothetical protein